VGVLKNEETISILDKNKRTVNFIQSKKQRNDEAVLVRPLLGLQDHHLGFSMCFSSKQSRKLSKERRE
jgi:hypothetical protein